MIWVQKLLLIIENCVILIETLRLIPDFVPRLTFLKEPRPLEMFSEMTLYLACHGFTEYSDYLSKCPQFEKCWYSV